MLPAVIKIIPNIIVTENNDTPIMKHLLIDSVISDNVTYTMEKCDNPGSLTIDYNEEKLSSLDVDILDLKEVDSETFTTTDKAFTNNFNDIFYDYNVEVKKEIIELENIEVIDLTLIKSTTKVDTLVLNNRIIEYTSRFENNGIFSYNIVNTITIFKFQGFLTTTVTKSLNGIETELNSSSIDLKRVKTGTNVSEYHLDNPNNDPWLGYALEITSNVVDFSNFNYVNNNTFSSIEDLGIGLFIFNKAGYIFKIINKEVIVDGFLYTVEPVQYNTTLNHGIDERNTTLDSEWTVKSLNGESQFFDNITQNGTKIHRIDKDMSQEFVLDLADTFEEIESVTIKVRAYGYGGWSDENNDGVWMNVNGAQKWFCKKNGVVEWARNPHTIPHYSSGAQYLSTTDYTYEPATTFGDWNQTTVGDHLLYRLNRRYEVRYTSNYSNFNIRHNSGFKDVEIILNKSELKEINTIEIGADLTYARDHYTEYSSTQQNESQYNSSAGFSDFQILLNGVSKSFIKRESHLLTTIINHKEEAISSENMNLINSVPNGFSVTKTFDTVTHIGEFYDIHVEGETEESFNNIKVITKIK